MYDGNQTDNLNTLSNIMTLNDETVAIDEKEWRNILLKVTKMINVIFYWENINISFYERENISNTYLYRFLNKIDEIDNSLQYLEVIQEKLEMDYNVYDNLLKELIKKMETNRSKTGMDLNDFILTKFYLEEPQCREKFENGNMKEFVRWLYY